MQAVGVGIGVDYAIYIVDRIRQEVADTADIDEAVRRAIRTTGMAVTFTATTVVGGIVLWTFSNLRFQAEMAQLLVDPDGHQHARRDHGRAGLLLDPAARASRRRCSPTSRGRRCASRRSASAEAGLRDE